MDEQEEVMPVCPACGAVAVRKPADDVIDEVHLETIHHHDCAWANDPDAPCYG